ncbi:MAG: MBL fold metallo-hydrolase [Pseudomonadota bacterium]
MYIGAGKTRVLIDAGLSGREINRRLGTIGVHIEDLNAVIISHEHTDHTRGLRVLCSRLNLPVYINYPTLSNIKGSEINGDVREFETGKPFSFQDLIFEPFSVPHDAADPVGFTIRYEKSTIGIATDLGFGSKLVIERLKKCDLLILESNHDEEMLKVGPYPWEVKQRIKSRLGHLSNHQAGALIREVYHEGLRHVILFHLSEINNSPRKADEGVQLLLKSRSYHPIDLSLALQHRASRVISLNPENNWI